MERLFFDDLAVGRRFESGSLAVSRDEVLRFAAAYDPQPFHLDDEAAGRTLFGRVAASGWHTAAMTMRLLVEAAPLAPGIIGSGGELRWPKPVYPGDVLRVVAEIVSLQPSRSRPDRGTAEFLVTTLNQHGETVQTFASRLVLDRRPAAA